jgi:signal transduction histidine kinase
MRATTGRFLLPAMIWLGAALWLGTKGTTAADGSGEAVGKEKNPASPMAEGDRTSPLARWLSPALRRLEGERAVLVEAMKALPADPGSHPSERSGWHSVYSTEPGMVEWVMLTLPREEALDAVVLLAPPLGGGVVREGYGFPRRFTVELLGPGEEGGRAVLTDYTRSDFPNPGLLPVVIPAGGRIAKQIRITATRLVEEGGRGFCALGEVMLLRGMRNLGAELEASGTDSVLASSSQGTRPDWGRINVVDGHTAVGPPLTPGDSPTLGYRSRPRSENLAQEMHWVEVDLGQEVKLEEVRLFPSHPPQFSHSHGYGFPVRYRIELMVPQAGGEVQMTILNAPESGGYRALPGDNVVTVVGGQRPARLVRVTALEPHVSNGAAVLALGEMQAWSGGRNVAAGQPVSSSGATEKDGWSSAALVDGYTSRGRIVDWPGWLAGLSQKRELFNRLAVLQEQRAGVVHYWQRTGLAALAVALVVGLAALVFWMLRQRQARREEVEALRQRISQDLHDEIGSSLGSIALITQDAMALAQDDDLRQELGEIRDTAQQTLDSMRDIVRLAQSGVYGQGDLTAHLQEIAGRMLRGVTHRLEETGNGAGEAFNGLPVDRRRDLVLMFKEALHNLARHAGATEAGITLGHEQGMVALRIRDNGRGFDPGTVPAPGSGSGMGLTNLQRRAAKHGGTVRIESSPGRGTCIHIQLPSHHG